MPKPHSFSTVTLSTRKTPNERLRALGPIAHRHGLYAKGTVLPETQALACPRVKVADLPEGLLKLKWIEQQEQNQLIASCCRHPENHEVEALKSHPDEPTPDVYIFHCTCGKRHIKFCAAQADQRPMWDAS